MMRTLLVTIALLTTASLLAPVCADPTGNAVNDTLGTAKNVVDGVLGTVDDATGKILDDKAGAGDKPDAGQVVGRFFEAVGAALGTAGTVSYQAVSTGTTVLSDGAAFALGGSTEALGSAVTGLGQGAGILSRAVGQGVALAASAIAAGIATLVGAYAGWVSTLRPSKVPEPAFTAVAAAGATAASASALWGLWGLLKKFGWMLGGIAGFSRIQDDELLQHPLRARIFQTIQATPGIHASELTRRLEVGWGTIVHHLEKMEKAKLLAVRRINNQRCYFEAGGKVGRMDMQTAGAVRAGTAHDIAQFVATNPMTSQKHLSAQLAMSAALASFHIKKLVALGVLTKVRRGKETLLSVSDSLRRVMETPAATPVAPQPLAAAPLVA